nr:immunoglobulin heavy chain junction region [Mus musculus]
CARTPGVFW